MSADNFGLIRLHPLGGFALVHGSTSSDVHHPPARDSDERFETLAEAESAADAFFYFEYGWHTHEECYVNDDGVAFVTPSVNNLMRLIHDLSTRLGVNSAICDCWEFIKPEWRGLWEHAVSEGQVINGLSPDEIGLDE